MLGLAVAFAAVLGSPPTQTTRPGEPPPAQTTRPGESPPAQTTGPGGPYASAATRARRTRPGAPRSPGPRLSPREEEPRGFRVQGHRILPIPTFRSEPAVGLTFGLRGRYVYRPPGENFDHARFDIVGSMSTRRAQEHFVDLQLRDILHLEEILDLGFRYIDDPVFPYVGVANFDRIPQAELLTPWYRVQVRSIGGSFAYQQPFAVIEPGQFGIETTAYARWLVGARFAHDRIESEPDTQWTHDGNPEDVELRRGSIFGGVAWDSRDNGWSPTQGSLHDVSIELGGPWVASTRHWARLNTSFRFYRPIGTPKVVLANQFLADVILGDAPLVSQGELGGLLVREGIGGRDTGRGYFRRRFTGPTKLYGSVELRVEPYELKIRRWTITPAIKAFMDVGYVDGPGQQEARPIISGGPGAYVIWDRFFVLRMDVGFSPEGYGMYFTSNHAF